MKKVGYRADEMSLADKPFPVGQNNGLRVNVLLKQPGYLTDGLQTELAETGYPLHNRPNMKYPYSFTQFILRIKKNLGPWIGPKIWQT